MQRSIIVCKDRAATVIYQGELEPKKYLRAEIPVPSKGLEGMVYLSATICCTTEVDPQDPVNYTRGGIVATFRRDQYAVSNGANTSKSDTFFSAKPKMHEFALRSDTQKWENVLHKSKRLDGDTLRSPVFDLHYIPRESGQDTDRAPKLQYALVLEIRAPKMPDLYNLILDRYRHQLEPLRPRFQIPLTP